MRSIEDDGGLELATHVVMPWLVRLRWVSVAALAGAAWAAIVAWRIRIPVGQFIALLTALVATNAALAPGQSRDGGR